jgi:hypothetical protein
VNPPQVNEWMCGCRRHSLPYDNVERIVKYCYVLRREENEERLENVLGLCVSDVYGKIGVLDGLPNWLSIFV